MFTAMFRNLLRPFLIIAGYLVARALIDKLLSSRNDPAYEYGTFWNVVPAGIFLGSTVIFWIGQTNDPRAVEFLEEIINQ